MNPGLTNKATSARLLTPLFWSAMDALYVCFIIGHSLIAGEIPLWSNINNALDNIRRWGGDLEYLIWVGLLIQLSVIASCILFYCNVRAALYISTAQLPFRLFFGIPSLPLYLLPNPSMSYAWAPIMLLIASEVIKGWSIGWLYKISIPACSSST